MNTPKTKKKTAPKKRAPRRGLPEKSEPLKGPEEMGESDEVEDGDLPGMSPVEIATAALANRNGDDVTDAKMAADASGIEGPLAAKINTELSRRYPEADLGALANQLRHSIAGCPATVYEYNTPVGVHAGEVTPQTIGALCLVVERLLSA